jgi:hypothetical protein
VVFRPLWDVQNAILSTFKISMRCEDRFGGTYEGYHIIQDYLDRQARIDLDHLILKDAIEIYEELFLNKFRSIVTIPVGYETVYNPKLLNEYARICETIPYHLRTYIIFSLTNFPDGVPTSKIMQIVMNLKEYSNNVFIHSEAVPTCIEIYKDAGVKVLSTRFNEKMAAINPVGHWQELMVFVNNCHKLSMQSLLLGVDRKENLVLAKKTGFDFICGDVIGEYDDYPGHMAHEDFTVLLK